ncbi:protocatechuate 3,4-dioxygenase [Mycolicibacterium novocastrense]|uniref:DODA-type extradiol aromatic ring-opening family dioxygenase n=1 Tax=Mycolicibacterium novocastrense TaxID=59813 RepID=UPI000AA80908|nr:protocatechuate 3,4-dioxygenase [Mycolicibacterium novocastrense]
MGKLVAALNTSHVLFPSNGVESRAAVVVNGYREIGRRVRAAEPDLVVLVSSEHGPTLPPHGPQPPFVVGTGQTFNTFGDMDVPKVTVPAAPEFAKGFVRYAADNGFDLASLDTFSADHGTSIPVLMAFPDLDVPVVPIIINTMVPEATASPRRCFTLGQVMARYIASRSERVAVIGCGGLSHWPGRPEMGQINEEFDQRFLDLLSGGQATQTADWSNTFIEENAGNGGLEIRNWIFTTGVAGDAGGETIYYEPIPQWGTGMSAIALTT